MQFNIDPLQRVLSSFGWVPFAEVPETIRSLFSINNRLFAIHGTTLSEFDRDGVATVRGCVEAERFDDDHTLMWSPVEGNVFIVSGGRRYVFTLSTNTLADFLETQFCDAMAVTFEVM